MIIYALGREKGGPRESTSQPPRLIGLSKSVPMYALTDPYVDQDPIDEMSFQRHFSGGEKCQF